MDGHFSLEGAVRRLIKRLLVSSTSSTPTTFDEVSQPYLDQYGQPEDVYKYDSDDYHTVDWWWWSQGFMVGFANTPYDSIDGWAVDNTYTFPPIGYLTQ